MDVHCLRQRRAGSMPQRRSAARTSKTLANQPNPQWFLGFLLENPHLYTSSEIWKKANETSGVSHWSKMFGWLPFQWLVVIMVAESPAIKIHVINHILGREGTSQSLSEPKYCVLSYRDGKSNPPQPGHYQQVVTWSGWWSPGFILSFNWHHGELSQDSWVNR